MNKQLLFALLSIFAGNGKLMAQEKASEKASHSSLLELGLYSTIYSSCKSNFSDNCRFLASHFENAKKFKTKKEFLRALEKQHEETVNDPYFKAAIEKDLIQARLDCPNADKVYWNTLSKDVQEKIANASQEIIRSNTSINSYAAELNNVHEALQK